MIQAQQHSCAHSLPGQLLEIQQQLNLTGSANPRIEREDIDDIQSSGEHVEEEHFDFLYGSDGPRAVRISTIDNFQGEEAILLCFHSCATTTMARLAS
jgi:hypothetical protein